MQWFIHIMGWSSSVEIDSAEEVSLVFFNEVIARHGCPDSIVTDQGSQLTSHVFTDLCTRFNTAYHKQTNGKVEKFIHFLKRSMATILVKNQSNWAKIISRCLFVYRISLNKTLDETPFY